MNATPIITRITPIFLMASLLWGCGSANDSAIILDATGKHPSGWVAVNGGIHSREYTGDPSRCRPCHGSDISVPNGSGGITKVNCSSASFGGMTCHANGHVPRIAPHVLPFRPPALHGPRAKADLTFCRGCHAVPFGGGPGGNPRFNAKIGSLSNGCETCHDAGTAHPATPAPDSTPWRGPFTHRDASNMAVACALCHGVNLDGSGGVGPACSTCHSAGSPLTSPDCSSCHGNPPAGALFPNISASHRIHNSLNIVNGNCSTCHEGAGIGSLKHFNGTVDVAPTAAYNAKSGTAKYDPAATTCSNVSCHGARTTPAWRGGKIDVGTQCTSCHGSRALEPPEQFNSYFSGKHDFHVFIGLSCTQCHDTARLATGHFSDLATPAFEQAPSATIRRVVNYTGGSCTPDNTSGNFSLRCHPALPLTRIWITP